MTAVDFSLPLLFFFSAVAEHWLRELEDQGRPLAASKIHYSLSVAEPLHYRESVPTHTADLVGYYPFHPDRQRRWLADLNEEIINVEAKNMLIELCAETLRESVSSTDYASPIDHCSA